MSHPTYQSLSQTECYQHYIRKQNLYTDLTKSGLTQSIIKSLKVSDFDLSHVSKHDQISCDEIKSFITRHEWLGTMPHRPTHRFVARYNGELAGVVIMSTPNAFSHLLGKENKDLEKLISRGACISWSPKNLASSLIMYSIRWMVKHTHYRYFTAYSDTEALELGTIYQACNFTYLGKNSGARYKYFDQKNPQKGWFSDRAFRHIRYYKRYAKLLGIKWKPSWNNKNSMLWENIPPEYERELREFSREYQKLCIKKKVPRKHKYVYIFGKNKRETRNLKSIFSKKYPHLLNLSYPKTRGK